MGYPVSYRKPARKYQGGGFQNPLTVPPGGKPTKAANDNWPLPDNDNDPGAGRSPPIKLPVELPFPGLPDPLDLTKRFMPPPVRKAMDLVEFAGALYPNFMQKPVFSNPRAAHSDHIERNHRDC